TCIARPWFTQPQAGQQSAIVPRRNAQPGISGFQCGSNEGGSHVGYRKRFCFSLHHWPVLEPALRLCNGSRDDTSSRICEPAIMSVQITTISRPDLLRLRQRVLDEAAAAIENKDHLGWVVQNGRTLNAATDLGRHVTAASAEHKKRFGGEL